MYITRSRYAADNMRIGDVYSQPTLSLPYTSAMSYPWFVNTSDTSALQALWLFEPFPSITGALSCWSMAKRVLARQGTLLLTDNMMVEIDRLRSPGTDPASLAAIDMMSFYKDIPVPTHETPHGIPHRLDSPTPEDWLDKRHRVFSLICGTPTSACCRHGAFPEFQLQRDDGNQLGRVPPSQCLSWTDGDVRHDLAAHSPRGSINSVLATSRDVQTS